MIEKSEKTPDQAIAELAGRIAPVASETISLANAAGRILSQPIHADRDSPAADVSAMDGYAIRLNDLGRDEPLPVSGESAPGHPTPDVQPGHAMRIFTGGIVPQDYDLVVKREETQESPDSIRLLPATANCRKGENIRRQGENASQGSAILQAGTTLHAGAIAAAANFGASEVHVSRVLKITILVTGDELHDVSESVQPWQLRDSNGPTLNALLSGKNWLHVRCVDRVVDNQQGLAERLAAAIEDSDAVILTGGVSMGDYDFVPDAIKQNGGEINFHRLPIRPGKPILGAVTAAGKPIIGLPGNPVSAAVGCRRFVLPLLSRQAGKRDWLPSAPRVMLDDPGSRTLPLHWFRLVQINDQGRAHLVPSKGSGDLVSMAASDGFTEQPPNSTGSGPWPYWRWHE
ncbi:Molybdopterin molybdenumtransferase [Rosistilla carotiformis]|uniref:Molybdopterin molybdenumtransferase n=1 Tax=Rosistilla carotiformis TaxID=2528017 RepID=A0A518K1J0_9BACT|nr:molybdopterin molybdotransferase MoeA [Rosistilla carotiformis]QDV71630.1 Molybdopterin molybdenumtransferase [Rosistilla carotiformis]